MRNAIVLPKGLILTTDNAAGIGEKVADIVQVDDETVAYFSARVALIEQWAANAHPITVIVQNFSGHKSWAKYVRGIEKLFKELELPCPTLTGSTESNMEMVQSAISVTMIGEPMSSRTGTNTWCLYGKPCVGEEVLIEQEKTADLKKIWEAIQSGLVMRVWPVGSNGIAKECDRLGVHYNLKGWDLFKSAGPATSVLLSIPSDQMEEAKQHFGEYFVELIR